MIFTGPDRFYQVPDILLRFVNPFSLKGTTDQYESNCIQIITLRLGNFVISVINK